jgi:hypothetical protein
MGAVHLVALHEADVLEVRRHRLDRVDDVDEHRDVGRDELGPGRFVLVRGIEDVGDLGEGAQFGSGDSRVQQVDAEVANAFRVLATAPGQADHGPVAECGEMADEVAADDAVRADH